LMSLQNIGRLESRNSCSRKNPEPSSFATELAGIAANPHIFCEIE
jgi:hypothetical protein